jgi:hypothetical protein
MEPHIILLFHLVSKIITITLVTGATFTEEEHRLRMFENRQLRRIVGLKRDEVTGGLRKLHKDKLRNLYSSPSIIRVMKSRRTRWAGHVTRMGEKRNA